MKKIIAILLFTVMVLALAIPAAALDVTINKGSPVIDGVRDELYSGPFSIENKVEGNGKEWPEDSANGNAWIAWDATSLYLYVEVYDKTPNNEGENEHSTDSAECMIDWKNAKGAGLGAPVNDDGSTDGVGTEKGYDYWQIRWPGNMNDSEYPGLCGGMWSDMDWDGVEWVSKDHEYIVVPLNGDYKNGYVCEIKIDAPNMTLSEGMVIPFDIQINDNMNGNSRDAMSWMTANKGNGMSWCTPQACGVNLTLGGAYVVQGNDEIAVVTPPPTTTSPTTGDTGMIIFAVMMILSLGFIVLKRKAVR